MAKALLQKARDDAIRAAQEAQARKNSQEKAVVTTAPIPISQPASTPSFSPTPSPSPSPPQIQQIIIYPQDNTALLREQAEKERVLALYKAEQAARSTSQEKHKEQVAKHEQLVKEDASLKRKSILADETIRRISQEKEQLEQEKEALRLELEKAKKAAEEIKLANKEEVKKEDLPVPPSYESHEETDVVELASDNNASYNDVPLTGDIAPDSPAEDGANDKCVVS